MLLARTAQPFGWPFGAGIAAALAEGSSSNLYAIPLVLKPAGFATARAMVLTATQISSWAVRRCLDRLDLVQVMKTLE